jgi:hypothetical protein
LRVGTDGFALRETVVEYHQLLTLRAEELKALRIRKPGGMPDHQDVTLYGGNAMVFDQFGLLKYNIGNSIFNEEKQSKRLNYLWQSGELAPGASKLRRFAAMHRRRMTSWSRLQGAAVDWTTVSAEKPEPAEEVQ